MADGWGFHRDKRGRGGTQQGCGLAGDSGGVKKLRQLFGPSSGVVFRVPSAGRRVPSFLGAGLIPFLFHPSAPLSIESSLRDS